MKRLIKLGLLSLAASFFSVNASASCSASLEANDMMQFNQKTLSFSKDCKEISIELKHTGKLPAKTMGHNIVVVDSANVQAVATDGMSAGIANQYVKPGDERVYGFSKIIGGGEATTLTFKTDKLKVAGDYAFFCSFPGHWAIMKGKLEFK
ncbi:azurin [Pseudoalteromonas sp. G4]|uniref:azurin n=1 Tax=Pseudoalteromonas sp. G4 TaxID=2992761 RepID=UPI00237D85F6|nr:azurin [Pseudoalteromonas sp. G4]MDE3272810.1 azurin [Pseudoalteromonas sp. G4]